MSYHEKDMEIVYSSWSHVYIFTIIYIITKISYFLHNLARSSTVVDICN